MQRMGSGVGAQYSTAQHSVAAQGQQGFRTNMALGASATHLFPLLRDIAMQNQTCSIMPGRNRQHQDSTKIAQNTHLHPPLGHVLI